MTRHPDSKYAAVLPGLPKLPPADAAYQDRVDRAKESIPYKHLAIPLADAYAKLRAERDEIEAELSALNVHIAAHEQLLVESQEIQSAGWGDYGATDKMLRLPSGATVRIEPQPSGQVVDKEAFRLWCIENGYERQLQLWPSTMNALVKERLLAGEAQPEGCEVFVRNKVVFTKGEK